MIRNILPGLALLSIAALCGCQAPHVPEVTPAMAATGTGHTTRSLQSGRAIFTTQCVACHGVQNLGKYSSQEWDSIVEKMAPRAHLSEAQRADLVAYIRAAKEAAQTNSVGGL